MALSRLTCFKLQALLAEELNELRKRIAEAGANITIRDQARFVEVKQDLEELVLTDREPPK